MTYTARLMILLLGVALPVTSFATLRITEVMTSNVATLQDIDGDFPDWAEIHNDGTEAVNLEGYFLTEDLATLSKWEFPAVTLEAGGYLVVFASGKDRRDPTAPLHTSFQIKNGGEPLALVAPDETTIVDAYSPELPSMADDTSYGVRLTGGVWVLYSFNTPSPGSENTGGTVAEEVDFALSGQPFTGTLALELSARSGGTITYTTNGKAPTLFTRKTYSGPIILDATTIISASVSNGPIRQEVYFKVSPEVAEFTSDLPVVFLNAASTITESFQEILIGFSEPVGEAARTTIKSNFKINSKGQARVRGSSSTAFPKKAYRIEFQDAADRDRNLKPFGMPAESDWILNCRYEEDRSLVRNPFIYKVSNQIGRYAVRTQFCELYAHFGEGEVTASDYVGAYEFMENIKIDGDRVDIDPLQPTDEQEPEITGGYMMKVDRAGSNDTSLSAGGQTFLVTDPIRSELTSAQRSYIQGYMNDVAASLTSPDPETGYPAFIDVGAWVDHHLLNCLMLNADALRLSAYFYKPRLGKVAFGPIWDFNISSGSRDRFATPPRPINPEVWLPTNPGDKGTTFFTNGTQRWWGTLFNDPDFQQAYCDRYNELRLNAFSVENMSAIIDGFADQLREAQVRNFARWPGASPDYGGFQGEIDHLKEWLTKRVEFMDGELVGPPKISPNGGSLAAGETITMTGNYGTLFRRTKVYYTLDGSDPRLPGGEISAKALEYTSPISLPTSSALVAREILTNYSPKPAGPALGWSAPATLDFIVGAEPASAENLVISEIMYHPSDPSLEEIAAGFTNADSFEYLELLNVGNTSLDLLGARLSNGVDFRFASAHLVNPGERVLLVADTAAFGQRYGTALQPFGQFTGQLRNSGETLEILSADGAIIVHFAFNDQSPWPTEADGGGAALQLVNAASKPDPSLAESWMAATPSPGTEGAGAPIGRTFEDWASSQFNAAQLADPAISGKSADPDNDGLTNVLEFVLLGNPLEEDSAQPLRVSVSDTIVSLAVTHQADFTGITLTVEESSDLNTWADASISNRSTSAAAGGTQETRWTLSASAQQAYLRLRVD